jgi:hypothetical protein
MADNVNSTTSPSRKQAALDITCALLATGQFTHSNPQESAQVAVELLNLVEHELSVPQTRHRKSG